MDFVERWLGFSPDGGDGTFEIAILAALAIALVVVAIRKRLRQH